MTQVIIEHNPFQVKTEITVDENKVTDTSGLYKILNTPMQDWVSTFIPILIEHCNDDELDITFKGLQFNYDDLENELGIFLRQNREYDIDLHFDGCKSQIARLGAIESLIDEMTTQTIVSELNEPEFADTIANEKKEMLQVVVVGGMDERRHSLVSALIDADIDRSDDSLGYCIIDDDSANTIIRGDAGDSFRQYRANISFISSKFCHMELYEVPNLATCKNAYYRFVKKAITSTEKPIVIYIIENDSKKNSEEFLNMVSDQYKIRGKQNKRRFIFVAEDASIAKRMLNSEYAIRNAVVYTPDEIPLLQRQIEEYQNEVCLIHQVKDRCNFITERLNELETKISTKAEQGKKVSEIDALEKQVIDLLYACKLNHSCEYQDPEVQDAHITAFFCRLENDYTLCLSEKNSGITGSGYIGFSNVIRSGITSENARERVSEFIESLPKQIEEQLANEGTVAVTNLQISISRKLAALLGKIGLERDLNRLKAFSTALNNTKPLIKPYICQVQDLKMLIRGKGAISLHITRLFLGERGDIKESKDGSYTYTLQFYDGLEKKCCDVLYGDGYLEKEKLVKSILVFRSELEKVRPVLKSYFDACVSADATATRAIDSDLKGMLADGILADIERSVKSKTQELREEADISEHEKKKLEYICELKAKFCELTRL